MPVTAVQRSVGEAAGTATDAHAAAFQNAASQAPGAGGSNPAANGGSDSQAQTRSGGVPPGGGSASPGAADVAKRVNPPATLPDTPTLPNPPAAPSGPDPHGGNLAADFESKMQSGDVDAVMRLIHDKPKGFDINATLPGTGGQNALQLDIAQGWGGSNTKAMAQALVNGGIDTSHLDGTGKSAYQEAAALAGSSGKNNDNFKDLATYLRHDLNSKLSQDITATYPIDNPSQDNLLKAGADANSPLFEAVYARDSKAVATIVAHMRKGADVNALDGWGLSALDQAVQSYSSKNGSISLGEPDLDIIKSLVNDGHADLTAKNQWGQTAYQRLSSFAGPQMASSFMERIEFLKEAATDQLKQSLKLNQDGSAPDQRHAVGLVSAGADGSVGIYGAEDPSQDMSIAQFAVASNQADLARAIVNATPRKDRAALINKAWGDGSTMMHLAAAANQTALYDYLKQQGGDDTIKNDAGKTPDELEGDARKRSLPLLAAASLGGVLSPVGVAVAAAAGVGFAAYALYKAIHGISGGGNPTDPGAFPSPVETGGRAPTSLPPTGTGNGPQPTQPPPAGGPQPPQPPGPSPTPPPDDATNSALRRRIQQHLDEVRQLTGGELTIQNNTGSFNLANRAHPNVRIGNFRITTQAGNRTDGLRFIDTVLDSIVNGLRNPGQADSFGSEFNQYRQERNNSDRNGLTGVGVYNSSNDPNDRNGVGIAEEHTRTGITRFIYRSLNEALENPNTVLWNRYFPENAPNSPYMPLPYEIGTMIDTLGDATPEQRNRFVDALFADRSPGTDRNALVQGLPHMDRDLQERVINAVFNFQGSDPRRIDPSEQGTLLSALVTQAAQIPQLWGPNQTRLIDALTNIQNPSVRGQVINRNMNLFPQLDQGLQAQVAQSALELPASPTRDQILARIGPDIQNLIAESTRHTYSQVQEIVGELNDIPDLRPTETPAEIAMRERYHISAPQLVYLDQETDGTVSLTVGPAGLQVGRENGATGQYGQTFEEGVQPIRLNNAGDLNRLAQFLRNLQELAQHPEFAQMLRTITSGDVLRGYVGLAPDNGFVNLDSNNHIVPIIRLPLEQALQTESDRHGNQQPIPQAPEWAQRNGDPSLVNTYNVIQFLAERR